jgi:hypothetical protein
LLVLGLDRTVNLQARNAFDEITPYSLRRRHIDRLQHKVLLVIAWEGLADQCLSLGAWSLFCFSAIGNDWLNDDGRFVRAKETIVEGFGVSYDSFSPSVKDPNVKTSRIT